LARQIIIEEMSAEEVESTKQMNFYLNSAVNYRLIKILVVSFVIIFYLMKKNNSNKRDEDNYDWNKYTVLSEQKYKK
jgi:hypothetical protein